ncbi:MAG: hypothetical protein MUF22_07105 [Chitinispirillaceae bacterium]|nr:hypothetical protein [Chitinispirillaceae bacterium]
MRLTPVMTFLMFAAVSLFAAEAGKQYVQPKEPNVGVYKNQIRQLYEEPIFKVGADDRLLIIDQKGDHFKVQDAIGQTGWVEKRLVVKIGKSKTFVFENAEVVGYLDNPTPVYILDSDDPNAERIYLDRSFKDAVRENVDKETIERRSR